MSLKKEVVLSFREIRQIETDNSLEHCIFKKSDFHHENVSRNWEEDYLVNFKLNKIILVPIFLNCAKFTLAVYRA